MSAKDVNKMVAELAAKAMSPTNRRRAVPAPIAPQLDQQMVLPGWDDELRGMPNALIRSSLFRATHPNLTRVSIKRQKLVTPSGIEIYQTSSEDLRQGDADVMFEILHLARNAPTTDKFHFTGYGMLKSLGWSKSGYTRLRESIQRLQETSIQARWTSGKKREGFQGSLVRSFAWKDEDVAAAGGPNRHWIVYLEPKLIQLFVGDDYTRVSSKQRRLLRHELSKWLHSFYHSHKIPIRYSIEFLQGLSGSGATEPREFRRTMKEALEDLERVGALSQAFIDEKGNVNVFRGTMEVLPAEEEP